MRSLGLTPRDYASFARADQGVLAAHKWFDMAGYEQMWQQRLGNKAAEASGGVGARYAYQDYTAPNEPMIFDWCVLASHVGRQEQGFVALGVCQRSAEQGFPPMQLLASWPVRPCAVQQACAPMCGRASCAVRQCCCQGPSALTFCLIPVAAAAAGMSATPSTAPSASRA